MTEKWEMLPGKPYPLGVSQDGKILNITAELYPKKECGLLLYTKKTGETIKIRFTEEYRVGDVYCVGFKNFPVKQYEYNFYTDEEVIVDPYAKAIVGNEVWHPYRNGYVKEKEVKLRAQLSPVSNPYPEDKPLMIPYHESFLYCLHVRGFTKHSSSKVRCKGTFRGIMEKIPYLKELGITAVELMPAYEFREDSVVKEENPSTEYAVKHLRDKKKDSYHVNFNYWGYQEGYYFSPKASYAYSSNPVLEFQTMVKSLHENGIEVIMQFYFPDSVKEAFMLEVLKYWVYAYHVDGFRLKGADIPMLLIATEPMLSHTKLMYDDVSENLIYRNKNQPAYKNIAYCSDDFSSLVRRFLKGDNGCLLAYQQMNRSVPEKIGVIRSITNYYGFRLADLVSYEQKHNEANGENNRDGVAYNNSWNCGAEGPTRKKTIQNLRMKQMKNALCMLFLSQGTPFLMSGDEFAHTQNGNNNPYNQDNEISWLNWRWNAKQKEILEFTKTLVEFRKKNQVLHKNGNISLADIYQCGYPEISYHTEELWKTDFAEYKHHLGFLYTEKREQELLFTYILVNMHWNEHSFALPKLKRGYQWKVVSNTDLGNESVKKDEFLSGLKEQVTLTERSVVILQSIRK